MKPNDKDVKPAAREQPSSPAPANVCVCLTVDDYYDAIRNAWDRARAFMTLARDIHDSTESEIDPADLAYLSDAVLESLDRIDATLNAANGRSAKRRTPSTRSARASRGAR